MPTFREDPKIGSKVPLIKTADLNDKSVTEKKLADGSITKDKIATGAVTSEKIQYNAVTTEIIDDYAVTTDKINDGAVTSEKIGEGAVTMDKIEDSAVVEKKISNRAVTNLKIDDAAVDTRTIEDKSVTNAKLADDTLTIAKFDPELRKSIQAATGLPENLLEMVQDVDISIAELQDAVFPITLGFSVTPDVKAMQTAIAFSVKSKGSPFLPDTLKISKTVNNGVTTLLADTPSSSGSLCTSISGAKEQFTFEVTKEGRTGKSTFATRFLCYYGSSSVATASEAVLNSLQKVSTTGLSFNPTIITRSGDYIWLVVPNDLTISRVTSAGFDITLAAAQTVTNSLGTFKAYRTANTLTAETWKLVIS